MALMDRGSSGSISWFYTILKSFGRLAALTVILVVIRSYVRFRRALVAAKQTGFPLSLGTESILGFLPEMRKNFYHLYDFRAQNYKVASAATGKTEKSIMYPAPIWIPTPVVATKDPAIVKHILKDNFENYLKSDILVMTLGALLGDGIFVVNHGKFAKDHGESWHFQRKTASKIFTRNLFKGHVYDTLCRNVSKISNLIDNELLKSAKGDSVVVPMQKQFFRFTLDTIGDIGFGIDLNTLNVGFDKNIEFATAFDTAQMLLARRMFTPFWQYFGRLYSSERIIAKNLKILDKFCFEIIDERLKLSAEQLSQRGDILSLFLQATENDKMPKKFFRDILMSFFIAGRDTTACTLTFAFYLISLPENRQVQQKLFSEVTSVLSKFNSDNITLEMLDDMPYLHGVVFEALRLFPPVPFDGKEAVKADILPGGHVIPGGTKIAWDAYAMGRDSDRFVDAEKMIPTRWASPKETSFEDKSNMSEKGESYKYDNKVEKVKFDQYEFPVFQAGPRICLGKDLAIFEAKVCIAELVKKYEFKFAEDMSGKEVCYKPGITMTFNGDLNLEVSRRQPN